jgi:hypothetical protein
MKNLSIILLLTIACYSYGQKIKRRECKSVNRADVCMQKLLLLGDPKFIFPETRDEMNIHCRTITATEKCIKDYSSKCLDAFPRQVTSVLAFGVAKTNKGYCTNQRRKDKFISIGKCGNQIKAEGDKCMQTYIDRLQGIETLTKSDNNLKVPLMCCNYFRLKSCIVEFAAKSCTQEVTTEVERIVDGYAHEALNLICGDYTEESDKCTNIVERTPKKLATQKRPNSLLPSFITILGSV